MPSSWLNALEQAIEAELAGPEDASEESEDSIPQPEEPSDDSGSDDSEGTDEPQ